AVALDRAALAFSWIPGSDRIAVTEARATSDALSTAATGQILFEEGVTGPVQMQLRLGPTILNPEGVFERRVAFDEGLIEARLTQSPLGLHLGQVMVTGPSGTARLAGRLAFLANGIRGTLTLAVPRMAVDELTALWPPDLQQHARRWFANNLIGGIARDVAGALRLTPGMPPRAQASFAFDGGRFRFMRRMPPAEDASGAAQLDGERFVIRVDDAEVPAIGPGEEATPETTRIAVNDVTFVIPDARARPAMGELSMRAEGEIGDILTLVNNRPLRLLDRLRRDRDLASGRGDARVEVRLPLRPGNAPADIDWSVEAVLQDVATDTLIPGRRLEGGRLRMVATPAAVEIEGALTFDGVSFEGGWRQALPPRSTEPILPDAPPRPPVPLPEPGRVTGIARVAPDDLSRLGIDLGAVDLRGRTDVAIDVTLPQGEPPRLVATSNLRGMAASLPAISWSKPAERDADFRVEATLGTPPDVTRVSLDAPGLDASGRVNLRSGGGLERAVFDTVRTG
ncbi:MAG: DUF3971 domain-containing protein, partial [Jannaschia sp.]